MISQQQEHGAPDRGLAAVAHLAYVLSLCLSAALVLGVMAL